MSCLKCAHSLGIEALDRLMVWVFKELEASYRQAHILSYVGCVHGAKDQALTVVLRVCHAPGRNKHCCSTDATM